MRKNFLFTALTVLLAGFWFGGASLATSLECTDEAIAESGVVACIENAGYTSLSAAIEDASAGATITLVADDHTSFDKDEHNLKLEINRNLEIDGNGHTLFGSGSFDAGLYNNPQNDCLHGIYITAGNVTIKNITFSGFAIKGAIDNSTYPIRTSNTYEGTLTIDSVTFQDFNNTAIVIENGIAVITGCIINGDENRKDSYNNEHMQAGISNGGGTVTIYNTTIRNIGSNRRYIGGITNDDGNITIESGTFEVNGSIMSGDTLVSFVAINRGTGKITINGGTFSGGLAAGTSAGENPFLINGGKFSPQPKAAYLAEGKKAIQKGDNWEVVDGFTVTFDPNNEEAVRSEDVVSGEKVDEPDAPIYTGYKFAGWLSGNDEFNFDTSITADLTLTGKWLTGYKVTFEANGGTEVASQTGYHGETIDEPAEPTYTGNIFQGWYLAGEEFKFSTPITGVITLTAEWEAITSTGGALIISGEDLTGMVLDAKAEATPTTSGDTIQTKGYTATVQGEIDLDVYHDPDGDGTPDGAKITEKVNFTQAVSVKIPVASGSKVKVKVKHNGDDSFGIDGLATAAAGCKDGIATGNVYNGGEINVNSGYAEIWTCSASKFVAYTETKNPDTTPSGGSSGGSSGGGGSKGGSSSSSSTTTSTTNKVTTNTDKKLDETKADDSKSDGNTPAYNDKYSKEFNDAYQFAYENGITTMKSIEEADMEGTLTRIAMAKMLSQYAINVLGKTPDTTRVVPSFGDVTADLDAQYNNGVTLAYQLGIMGIGIDKFRPFDTVTRAEFGTALSRLLFNTPDGVDAYYSTHLQKLMEEKIITNNNPDLQELRGYVMIMLMRSANS